MFLTTRSPDHTVAGSAADRKLPPKVRTGGCEDLLRLSGVEYMAMHSSKKESKPTQTAHVVAPGPSRARLRAAARAFAAAITSSLLGFGGASAAGVGADPDEGGAVDVTADTTASTSATAGAVLGVCAAEAA